jgi:hypothetical protein
MDVCEARVEEETVQHGLLVMTAPVNHNKLNQSKTIQIVHTILGNAYQDEQEVTIANQDFGNDACIIVGYHDKLKTQPGKNRVVMKDLHPNNDEQQQKVSWFVSRSYRQVHPATTVTRVPTAYQNGCYN